MVLDLYARLERWSWLDLVRLPVLFLLSCVLFVVGATVGEATEMRFTETTGRAVIVDPALEQEARLLALEEALYLAALEGGARIDGFSAVMTDSALEDHFVIRPASRILDYTITNEVIDDLHYQVSIRAAVGDLPKTGCSQRRHVNVTVFAPRISHGPKAPAEAGPMAAKVITTMVKAIESTPGLNATRATDKKLNPKKLARTTDAFDYTALTTGIVRVRRGDFALVPEIVVTGQRGGTRFEKTNQVLVTVRMHLFAGESYAPVDVYETHQLVTVKLRTPLRVLNVLGQPRRPAMLEEMTGPAEALVAQMAAELQCQPIRARITIAGGELTVPIGSHHGMRQNALAVASGTDTPWQIMRVTGVDAMSSTLTPLNDRRDITTLAGKTVEFMEVPQ